MKAIHFLSLLGFLLSVACSSIERGVVVAKGHEVGATSTTRTQDFWVDVRGKNRDGNRVTERLHLFKGDWARLRKGDAISPQDFDMLGLGKAIRASGKRFAEIGGEPTTEAAVPAVAERRVAAKRKLPVPQTETDREERFRSVEARAHADPAVREFKLRIHNAKTDEEQAAAWREHRRALFQKMRELDPSLKDRIDQAESAP